ncbi:MULTISPECIES: hypothetical protein [Okeania]|uniref:hypothetical protein n=1 Tax=Okeania TaxID=1458928 RepID=UPI001374ACAD|nr:MULTISPECIES: hypothetical protein [Okeania]NET14459.1 hypothetical protein [Okeania sp. SIO1H6]NET22589.1 hypothetical protein [Okeania sp. SIO1H5]NET79238.1 hypothetical protein [Okeania sp. SIO1F9]NET95739.1 hypothetical protein [Okeania sp. SIO1H2]
MVVLWSVMVNGVMVNGGHFSYQLSVPLPEVRILNKAKNLSLLGNSFGRQRATGNI